jgi:hypothetical protein
VANLSLLFDCCTKLQTQFLKIVLLKYFAANLDQTDKKKENQSDSPTVMYCAFKLQKFPNFKVRKILISHLKNPS